MKEIIKITEIKGNIKICLWFIESSIQYAPTDMYYFASNLEPDKEYTFEVCHFIEN